MKQYKYKNQFQAYLENLSHVDEFVNEHVREIRMFVEWLVSVGIQDVIRITTANVFEYMDYQKEIGNAQGTKNRKLNSLRKYYDCLFQLGHITRNPALGIHIGKRQKKVVESPLSDIQLHQLYVDACEHFDTRAKALNYKDETFEAINQRNKLIVSLMVYQGMDSGELDRLTVDDVNPSKGTIYIASSGRRKQRVLKMEASQTIPLYEYLRNVSPNQTKLFDICIQQSMDYLLKTLKGIQPLIRNAEHIRQSRILVWVGKLDIRTAQYQIGHKYVSSTEKYQVQNTDDLVEELNRIHLFK